VELSPKEYFKNQHASKKRMVHANLFLLLCISKFWIHIKFSFQMRLVSTAKQEIDTFNYEELSTEEEKMHIEQKHCS